MVYPPQPPTRDPFFNISTLPVLSHSIVDPHSEAFLSEEGVCQLQRDQNIYVDIMTVEEEEDLLLEDEDALAVVDDHINYTTLAQDQIIVEDSQVMEAPLQVISAAQVVVSDGFGPLSFQVRLTYI